MLAVSVDSVFTVKAWYDQQGYDFARLPDFWPHGKVMQDYAVFNDKAGMANRGPFLVGTDGVACFAQLNQPGRPM